MKWLKDVNVSKVERITDLLNKLRKNQGLKQLDFEDFIKEEFDEEYSFGTSCVTFKIDNLAFKYTYSQDKYIIPFEYEELKDYKFPRRPEHEILSKLNTKYFAEIYAYGDDFVLMDYIKSNNLYDILLKYKNPDLLFLLEKEIEHIFLDCLKRGILPTNLLSHDFHVDKEGNVKIVGTTAFIMFEDIKAVCGTFPFNMTLEELAELCLHKFIYGIERDDYIEYLKKYGIDLEHEKLIFNKKINYIFKRFTR